MRLGVSENLIAIFFLHCIFNLAEGDAHTLANRLTITWPCKRSLVSTVSQNELLKIEPEARYLGRELR
jgi:hypothetical protein